MKNILHGALVAAATFSGFSAAAQLVAGPMPAAAELRSTNIWLAVGEKTKSVTIEYWPEQAPGQKKQQAYTGVLQQTYNPIQLSLNNLEINTRYQYRVLLNNKAVTTTQPLQFSTKELWQSRKPAPDFSFLAGSCAYFNEQEYDRPGAPYGQDSSIFTTMAQAQAQFMLWLGDNWYYREVDYFSPGGLWYRAMRDRSLPILQPFLQAMPHLASWDDHDFGPNDADQSYILKDEATRIFRSMWANPSYGQEGKGVYTKYSYSDVDFFILDDRTWRSNDDRPATDSSKIMLGAQQLTWLKDALAGSKASFKVIVNGSQVINTVNPYDCLCHFNAEYRQLMDYLQQQRIKGVLFLSGDRHHSEILKAERPGTYPLYEITASPLTSRPYVMDPNKPSNPELNNPLRVPGTLIEVQNYARISVSGAQGKRVLEVTFLDIKGNAIFNWSVAAKELQ
jgi:alkaline phosphatase D